MKWENVLADVRDRGAFAIKVAVANTDSNDLRARASAALRDKRIVAGLSLAGVLLVAGIFYLTRPAPPDPGAAAAADDMPLVTATTVELTRLAPQVTLAGSVVSLNDSQLASEVEGKVASIVDVGTVVNKGDIIVQIDKSLAAMQLASDKANVQRLAAQVTYDRNQAERMQNLLSQAAIAKATRDQAVSTRDMDEAALVQAQAALAKSQYQFDHSEIRAPFAGRVVSRLVNPGEYVTAGKAVARLVDIGSLEVSAQAPIQDAQYLHEGMTVPTVIEDKTIQAPVHAIVPVGDELSRTIEMRLSLKPGQAFVGDAAKVIIPSAAPRMTLAVPRDALLLRDDATYIFKLDRKNTALRVAVETGAITDNLVEIHGPIQPGDRVIIRGAERLEAGQKVRVSPARS